MRKIENIELKLIAELMKNSRRGDRELARLMGISQPTVTRTRARIEKEGYIREYTLIPDFKKLGYHIMAILFLKLGHPMSQVEREETLREALQVDKGSLHSPFLIMDGIGMSNEMVMISFFRNFAEYSKYIQSTRTETSGKVKPFLHAEGVTGFLLDLDGNTHYQSMTFSKIAHDVGQ